ncbi:MAG: peptidylprolyl isomerase [Bacteroidales bacterium]|nr:peptidylprolyl isomerase [Bacteroidales bacterium]
MKKIAYFLTVLLTAIGLSACTCQRQQKEQNTSTQTVMEPLYDINTTMGTIRVKLYAQTPKHKQNFEKLAAEGFYNDILFHRVINGFMIQAGDPLTKDPANADLYGTGGPDYTVPAEFVPEYRHLKGALAAARKGDFVNPSKASSGSQFYIVQDERNCAQLDGQYTVFGQTVEGFDVIDKIAAVETNFRDCPLEPVRILSVVKVVPEESKAAADSTAVADSVSTK